MSAFFGLGRVMGSRIPAKDASSCTAVSQLKRARAYEYGHRRTNGAARTPAHQQLRGVESKPLLCVRNVIGKEIYRSMMDAGLWHRLRRRNGLGFKNPT